MPKKFNKKFCQLKETNEAPIDIAKKISTKEELYAELEKMRNYYEPFLQNYAPETISDRVRIDIKEFVCDGKNVIVPEYGGPLGNAKKVYTSQTEIPEIPNGHGVYIHFDGADYYAVVYVNGICVGTHEFFSLPLSLI